MNRGNITINGGNIAMIRAKSATNRSIALNRAHHLELGGELGGGWVLALPHTDPDRHRPILASVVSFSSAC